MIKPAPRVKAVHPTAGQFVLALLANDRPDPAADLLAHLGGLFQRLTITIGFTWLALFGAAMLVNRRDLG